MSRTRRVDEILDEARARLRRVTPTEAELAAAAGALIVDIRPADLRDRDGRMPGALVIGRNVLEWRLDPVGPDRVPQMKSHDQVVIIVCDEGYASSLAAATLQHMGIHAATDLIGGFQAWRASGAPVER